MQIQCCSLFEETKLRTTTTLIVLLTLVPDSCSSFQSNKQLCYNL